MSPNWFALFVLFSWPLVALGLYRSRPIGQATVLTILCGFLLLPVGTSVKIEMIPAFDKSSIPNLSALLGCVLVARRVPPIIGRFDLTGVMILLFFMCPMITSGLNGDTVKIGPIELPGVGQYDAVSAIITTFISFVPFILARQF